MLNPRNTLVTVVEVKGGDKQVASGLVIPARSSNEYKLCEIVAVGPGMATHPDEISTTHDLKPGQRVIVKLHQQRQISANQAQLQPIGIEFTDDDGRPLVLVEQSQIVATVSADLQLVQSDDARLTDD